MSLDSADHYLRIFFCFMAEGDTNNSAEKLKIKLVKMSCKIDLFQTQKPKTYCMTKSKVTSLQIISQQREDVCVQIALTSKHIVFQRGQQNRETNKSKRGIFHWESFAICLQFVNQHSKALVTLENKMVVTSFYEYEAIFYKTQIKETQPKEI